MKAASECEPTPANMKAIEEARTLAAEQRRLRAEQLSAEKVNSNEIKQL